MRQVTIEWRHLDVGGQTCDRCGNTGSELNDAIGILNRECASRDVVFTLRDTPLTATDLDQSNAILIDGRPIEELLPDTSVGSSGCSSCGTLVGDDNAACRTLEQGDALYETVPAELIREAACRVVACCTSGGCGCK